MVMRLKFNQVAKYCHLFHTWSFHITTVELKYKVVSIKLIILNVSWIKCKIVLTLKFYLTFYNIWIHVFVSK